MNVHLRWLVFVLLVAISCVWIALPDTRLISIAETCSDYESISQLQGIHLDTNGDCELDITFNVQQSLGLDLVGGLRVLLQAELPPDAYTIEDLRQTSNNVSRRVNALGVTEPTVQLQGSSRILVELPGVTDPEQAVATIQQTALLEFVDFASLGAQVRDFEGRRILTTEQVLIQQNRSADSNAELVEQPLLNPLTGQPFETVMTGAGLQAAAAQLSPDSTWVIGFDLTPEGGSVFGPFTANRLGQPMAIVLDGIVLSAPVIQSQLDTGGVITGQFTEEEAKTLALQLRSGALPIPLRVESAETVGATLGQESVNLSIRAGVIGVIIVLMFMLIYYRVPGIAASGALLVFIVINMAVFKIVPITLTLPAITGFLISIGTAVDGNILIFERIKEELRGGNTLDGALISGFDRAWNSIRDSNFSTIIISGILFLFGQTPGASIVSGFAVTLALGLIVNLFTAVIVTRTFLNIIVMLLRQPLLSNKWLLGV